mgnify:CR=1 FL=1
MENKIKYTICRKGEFLANPDNSRMLFDSRMEAEEFKTKNSIDASVMGYLDKNKMMRISGFDALRSFQDGVSVYTKIFGLDWILCEKDKFDLMDFTNGVFEFYRYDGK